MRASTSSCLVIGGAGNLGSNIVQILLEKKYRVSTFDLPDVEPLSAESNRGDKSERIQCDEKIERYYGDVTCMEDLVRAMEHSKASIIFHVASIIDLRPVVSTMMRKVNVEGTRCVLDASACTGYVETIIYTSSMEVVSGYDVNGNVQLVDGIDEDTPYAHTHHLDYASTKCEAEKMILAADGRIVDGREPRGSQDGTRQFEKRRTIRTCAIRPGYIVGAHNIGLKIELLTALQNRGGWYVSARAPSRISIVHPRNCASMHVLAAQQIDEAGVHGKAFFCRDFEANVVEMNVAFFENYTGIKCLLIPLWLAMCMCLLVDRIERALVTLYQAFGYERQTPSHIIGYKAANMAFFDIIVSDERGRKVLGYKQEVSRDACLQEAGEWCREFYEHAAGVNKVKVL